MEIFLQWVLSFFSLSLFSFLGGLRTGLVGGVT